MYEVDGFVRGLSEDEAERAQAVLDSIYLDWFEGVSPLYGAVQLSGGVTDAKYAEAVATDIFAVTGRFVEVYVSLAYSEGVDVDDDEPELEWCGYAFDEAEFTRIYATWCAQELECRMNS